MILEQAQRLADLTEQLSETLMAAAICADEIRAILPTELDSHTPVGWGRSQNTKPRNPPRRRPATNRSGRAEVPTAEHMHTRRGRVHRADP